MSSFGKYKLDQLGQILDHKRIPINSKLRKERSGQFPYYGASGIVDYIDGYIFEGEHVLISEDGENLRTRQTPIAFKADGKFWVNNHAHIFKGKKKWINDYIVYYFQNTDINPYITGAVQPKLNKENLLTIPIKTLDENTTKNLVKFIRSFDDKIELNLQMNQTLEAIAQAIFKEWFVNFRINNEKLRINKKTGLPEGWKEEYLGKVVAVKGGSTPSTIVSEYWNGKYYWATPKDLSKQQSPVLLDTERKITEAGVKQISSSILPEGTLLLSSRAPIGYLTISQIPISINQGFIAIQGKIVSNLFMYFWLKLNMDKIIGRSNGSTFQEINKTNFKEIKLIVPDKKLLKLYDGLVNQIFEKIVINTKENQTLTQLRDSLLPRLMSGKINVSR